MNYCTGRKPINIKQIHSRPHWLFPTATQVHKSLQDCEELSVAQGTHLVGCPT